MKQLALFNWLKPAKKKLTQRKQHGNDAEQVACDYLQKQGLILLTKNFSITAG